MIGCNGIFVHVKRTFLLKNASCHLLICKLSIALRWRKRQTVIGYMYFFVIYENVSWFLAAVHSSPYGNQVMKELWKSSLLIWTQKSNFLFQGYVISSCNQWSCTRSEFWKLWSGILLAIFLQYIGMRLIPVHAVRKIWILLKLMNVNNVKIW